MLVIVASTITAIILLGSVMVFFITGWVLGTLIYYLLDYLDIIE